MEYTTKILKINQHVSMTILHGIIIAYIYTNQAHRDFPNGNNVSIQVKQKLIILSLSINFLLPSRQIPK